MYEYNVTYKHVKRVSFERMSALCSNDADNGYFSSVTVNYNGTNLYGDISIDVSPGKLDIYKKVIVEFAKIIAEDY